MIAFEFFMKFIIQQRRCWNLRVVTRSSDLFLEEHPNFRTWANSKSDLVAPQEPVKDTDTCTRAEVSLHKTGRLYRCLSRD